MRGIGVVVIAACLVALAALIVAGVIAEPWFGFGLVMVAVIGGLVGACLPESRR